MKVFSGLFKKKPSYRYEVRYEPTIKLKGVDKNWDWANSSAPNACDEKDWRKLDAYSDIRKACEKARDQNASSLGLREYWVWDRHENLKVLVEGRTWTLPPAHTFDFGNPSGFVPSAWSTKIMNSYSQSSILSSMNYGFAVQKPDNWITFRNS